MRPKTTRNRVVPSRTGAAARLGGEETLDSDESTSHVEPVTAVEVSGAADLRFERGRGGLVSQLCPPALRTASANRLPGRRSR
jgi:hypothetical protein